MKIKSIFVWSAIAFASLGAQASTNLIQNGSFESNALLDSTWQIFSDGQVANWASETHGIELRTNVDGIAQEGRNFVELDTTQNSWMKQTVTIGAPGSYLLSFWYNARPNVTGPTDMIGWSFGGQEGHVKPSDTESLGTWRQFSQTFTFSDPQKDLELRFHSMGPSDSFGGSLDNVSVTAVPEPESYAMMIAGLGLMAAIGRRRNKRQA